MFQVYVLNISSVSNVCCKRFHQDVTKVDPDVCICMHVASKYFKCFRCFIHTLQVFHLNVAHVCNDFQVFFQVFQTHVLSVLYVFFCML
jgi:hypothetical protein